jgi:two-component system cell cycle sensor histidine kinase/response regulator CckA
LGLENDFSGSISDPDRVAAVRRTGLLDAPADHALDRLTRIACHVLRVPAALVCLVDDDRQFFASMEGLPEPLASSRQTPLTHSFCRYAVASRADFVVSDARQDEELRTHPAVTELGFVAYAGVPLLDPEGRALGTLCAIDHERRDWTEDDLAALHDLADFATERLRQRPGDLPADLEPAAGSARLSFDALPVMLWTVAPDGRCDYVNARWLEFTGRPLGAELGTEWTERIHPDDREERRERFQAAVTQRAPLQLEYRMRRYDDQYRWLLDLAVPRFGPDGEFLGLIGCSTDVTDRRQLEQRLVQAERAQAITQLAGGIAHDFNNLLTGIIGHVTLLEEEPALPSLAREDLGQIRHSAERAASLTRQLLAFSRRQVLAPRVLDLNNLVADSLSRVRRVVGEGVQVVWAPAASLDPIVADPTQIEQVLIQLSGTARDAMPNGGALELTTRQERLDDDRAARLSAPRSGTYVVLQARDTGRGMEAASLSRVFEPFSGARPSREDTGLGLASAYGIMKQSGGLIEVTSEPGRGTTFTLYFPRHEGSGPVGAAVGAREPLGGSETLLLVEDEEQVRELGRRVLERVGYTVLAAPDAESATAIADRHAGHIHLLITDMLLPQLSGRELAARLSIHRPAIKVLYISGTAEASIARLRLLEPGTRFLEKPFSLDRLLRTVRHALGDPESAARPG